MVYQRLAERECVWTDGRVGGFGGKLIAAASGSTRVEKGYGNGYSRGRCTSAQWRGVQRLALREVDSSRADIKQEKMG
jgi:hypothetical protein